MTGETTPTSPRPAGLGLDAERQRARLAELHLQLRAERAEAVSPAVERALEMAEMLLFMGLSYLGYTDQLFPEG